MELHKIFKKKYYLCAKKEIVFMKQAYRVFIFIPVYNADKYIDFSFGNENLSSLRLSNIIELSH